jgi:TM2 domain-containing membrane protein YozV
MPPQPAPAIPQPARRAPVNYQPNEPGWWLASDGLWYPPEAQATAVQPPLQQPLVSNPSGHAQTVIVQVAQPYGWQPMPPPPPMIVTNPPRSKMTAALLAFFLGAIGAHRFDLGNNGMGMVMLLASVLSLGFLAPLIVLWSLIEMIIILTGGMRDAQGRVLA